MFYDFLRRGHSYYICNMFLDNFGLKIYLVDGVYSAIYRILEKLLFIDWWNSITIHTKD